MANPETVSVVIPLYNAAAYIAETVASILKQSFTDLHLYVVDDFSTDGSAAIVEKIAQEEPRVTYHKMPRKGGCPAVTKNEGVRLAQGQLVAFCDHDDWWHPEKLAKQVAFLETHPEVTLLGCNVEIVDTVANRSLGTFWQNPERLQREPLRRLVLEGPIFATTTCMMGRRAYLLEHPFDERLLGSDEYDLSLHATLDNPAQVAVLPEVLAYWRWHTASLSHSDQAAERALHDEKLFAEKILARGDLSPEEISQVKSRVRMVTRRAGNAELEAGHTAKALEHYRTAADEGDRMSKILLSAATLAPPLTRRFVTWKRAHSHAAPIFR